MKRHLALVALLAAFLIIPVAGAEEAPSAADGFSGPRLGAALGRGGGLDVRRLWLRWGERRALLGGSDGWRLDFTWQAAYTHLDCSGCVGADSSHVVSVAPVFRIVPQRRWLPFVELWVGLSRHSETEINGRRLGGHFQFEDVLGLGWWLDEKMRWELAVRAMHFSNARLYDENDGLTFANLSLAYRY